MQDAEVRNSFLTGVIGENVTSSELLDGSLTPMRSYTALRELINDTEIRDLMAEVDKDTKVVSVHNVRTQRPVKRLADFLTRLAPLYHELVQAIPAGERNTQLDLVCQTATGIVNVEVQVDPQDFWDIRILDHACGLFHRQFSKGFRWSQLMEDADISRKVRRVIGVSILEKPPVSPESVHALLPWYNPQPWAADELRRHYRLLDTQDPKKERSGIEFFDYNLAALRYRGATETLPEGLREWLDLLANAHLKTKEEAGREVKVASVRKAYHMLESASLPETVRREYEEAQKKRFQISFYVADEKSKSKDEGHAAGRVEGQIEVLKSLIEDGTTTLDDILKSSRYSEEVKQKLKELLSSEK
jgi:hypothetical protein